MCNSKRILTASTIVFLLGAFAAYANGQREATNLTGTVTLVQSQPSDGTAMIVVKTQSGSYTVVLDRSIVVDASLVTGKHISLQGVLHRTVAGEKELDASEIEVDGHQYQISQVPATEGIGSGASSSNIANAGQNGNAGTHHQTAETGSPEAKQPVEHSGGGHDS